MMILAVFAVAFGSLMLYAGNFAGDDTFIYMRYVENALHGHGWTYNSGEPSYGVTSWLWMAFMTPYAAAFGNTIMVWKVASASLAGARACLVYTLTRRLSDSLAWALALTSMVMLEPHTFRWAATGMEGSLALLMLTGVAWLHCQRWRGRLGDGVMGALLGALPFARPELGLVSLGMLAFAATDRRRERRVVLGAAASAGLSLTLLTWWSMGGVLPGTAEAKAIFSRSTDATYGLFACAKVVTSGACGAAIALLATRKASVYREWYVVAVGSVLVSVAYLAWRNQYVTTRYATYLTGPIVLAAAISVADAAGKWREGAVARIAVVAQIAASALVLGYVWPSTRATEVRDIEAFSEEIEAMGLLDASSRVALAEVGIYGHASNRYIIDLCGLTDRETVAWGRVHGRPRTTAQLEDLLLTRGATHYIDAFAGVAPLAGERVRFVPLVEHEVTRSTYSAGALLRGRWRLYSVELR